MRRKSDMWQDFNESGQSFLPGENEQAVTAAAADVRERLVMVEEQLKSQFTSMAAYARISQDAIETARAESRADLDREKSTLVSLIERVRDDKAGGTPRAVVQPDAPAMDVGALARIALLEDRFERLNHQFAMTLKSQEELANSIAFMFEHSMRNAGWLTSCAEAAS